MSANPNDGKKRSLILAGGGVKVSFQAGVLQVWLDEAGLKFDHVDAASGGTLNLAMVCQGMSGLEIADNWRNTDPRAGISFNGSELPKLLYAESLFTLDNYRRHVFTGWGLDWGKIRASRLDATFNVFNFSRKENQVVEPKDMSEDMLCACVSLPMWFPPVRLNGETYIDAVYMTDANIEEAIRRGADEVWVIWTVSDKDEWRPGFVATYFQIIETSAVGHYRAILKRIAENNGAVASGGQGEFGRHIEVYELKAEVPLHYLINLSQDRLAEAVNLGVQQARRWCEERGIPLKPHPGEFPVDVHEARTKVSFTEEMKGFMTFGEMDFERGARLGKESGTSVMFRLTITVDGVNRFVKDPGHDTDDVKGYVKSDALGGQREVERARFNLLVDDADPARKWMLYRLFFRDGEGRPLTLSGFKDVYDDPGFDAWKDTTTLYTRILRGHVSAEEEEAAKRDPAKYEGMVLASGIIIIHFFDFLRQLTTFRAEGPTLSDRAAALSRFGALFMGKLWDVYARNILTSSPF
ncbi:MAG TPA: patatin-like phospholipase family protein [Pyrinomonadaceae bacterium]|nr:patatin-like phospholipase family protein [Pyrinomonadaceae bacterium]